MSNNTDNTWEQLDFEDFEARVLKRFRAFDKVLGYGGGAKLTKAEVIGLMVAWKLDAILCALGEP